MFRFRLSVAALAATVLVSSAQAGIVALYTFEDYAGEATVPNNGFVEDTSGNDRHLLSVQGRAVTAGSTVGSTALSFSGNAGDWLEFVLGHSGYANSGATASSSDIVIGSVGDSANWSFTIETIVKLPVDNSQGNVEGGILGKGGPYAPGTTDADEWGFVAINNGTSHLNTVEGFLGDGKDGTSGIFRKTSTTNITIGWRHLALVRNRLTDSVKFYVDGVETDSEVDSPASDWTNALGNFVIGGNRTNPNKRFRGDIDMVRISDTALDPEDFWSNPVIPEPSSLMLLSVGLVCMALRRKRN